MLKPGEGSRLTEGKAELTNRPMVGSRSFWVREEWHRGRLQRTPKLMIQTEFRPSLKDQWLQCKVRARLANKDHQGGISHARMTGFTTL